MTDLISTDLYPSQTRLARLLRLGATAHRDGLGYRISSPHCGDLWVKEGDYQAALATQPEPDTRSQSSGRERGRGGR